MSRIMFALWLLAVSASAESEVPPGRWTRVQDLAPDPSWAGLQARFGAGWSVYTDLGSGAPSLIAGPPIPAGMIVRADEAGVARARRFLEELREVLRVDDPSAFAVERAVAVTNPWGQEVVYINLKQTWNGLDVRHQSPGGDREKLAMVLFRFKGTDLVMSGSDAVPGFDVPGEVRLEEAEAIRRSLGSATLGAARIEKVETRSYVSVRGSRTFLAREVEVLTSDPPHDWRFVYDAHTGELEEQRDDVRHADLVGNVKAGSLDFPGGTFAQRNAQSLRVTALTGAFDTTDVNGNFRITHPGTSPILVSGRFLGDWAVVNDVSGNGNLGFTQQAVPGANENVILNPANLSELESAEAAAYHWTTTTRFAIQAWYPGFNGLANLPVNVNTSQSCSSSYFGTLNFSRSGNGCNNTAFADVVAHEYGHGFHAWFHGSTIPYGFSDGIADHVAFMLTRSRVIGRNYHTNGNPLRDYREGGGAHLTQWPCTGCAAHKAGEAWAGFTMDLYSNLVAVYGTTIGSTRWHQITVPLYAANPADEAQALTEAYLLDDDDATLANGTPNCPSLTSAARRHSLPIPWLLPTSPCGNDLPPPSPEYRTPVEVSALNGGQHDSAPAVSGSGLSVWFISTRAGGVGSTDIWTSSRSSISGAWSAPTLVPGVNSTQSEISVAVSDNGLEMFLASDRPGGSGGYDLYWCDRTTPSSPWSAPVALSLNTNRDEVDPSITGDGTELFFASNRGSSGTFGIWSATRLLPPTGFGSARVHRDTVGFDEVGPAVSSDGLKLFWSTNASGNHDWFQSRRTAPSFAFEVTWRSIGELNTGNAERGGDETLDGFSFFFARRFTFGPSTGIYRADRIQPRLNGPRWGAANQPVSFRLRRDPGDFGIIVLGLDAIPPTPVPPVVGVLGIVPLLTVASAVHDANGIVGWTTPVPSAPGVVLHLQGISQDPGGAWYLSDRLSFLIVP